MSTIVAVSDGWARRGAASPAPGEMACDSVIYMNGMALIGPKKIWKSKRTGSLLGCAGASAAIALFKAWYEAGAEDRSAVPLLADPNDAGSFNVLELRNGTEFYGWWAECVPIELGDRNYMAIGCGAQYALGALEAGMGAQDAVRVAIKYDPNSIGPVEGLFV